MATKSVSEATVNERRLRPIYDCLDNGNNKKALQEAEKLLKKQKDLQCAKVLKCLALSRLGQSNKSMELLKEVHKEAPTDDCTLQAMAICYREMNRADLIADAYENASKKEPLNEDLMIALFMAYVRLGHFKKQQQTALNLYKLKPKNSYYFWAIMSIYMQAITNKDSDIANKMFLPLAQKMCKKFIDEEKMDAESEVELYLMILEKQEKHEEMLKAINGPLAKLLPNYLDFLKRRKAFLYLKTSLYQEAFETFLSLIDHNVDQLEYYQQLFEVAFILDQSDNSHNNFLNEVPKREENLYTSKVVETVSRYLCKNDSSSSKKDSSNGVNKITKFRGPYIARIELYEILKARCDSHPSYSVLLPKISDDPVDLYTQFFTLFGHKGASFYDLSYLFTKYNRTQEFVCSVIEKIKSSNDSIDKEPSTMEEMFRLLCFLKLNYYAGKYCDMDDNEKRSLISRLIDLYDLSIKFGAELLPNDFKPNDPFILIISYLLMNEGIEDNSTLLNLLTLLERSLKNSPSNYSSKLALIKLNNIIGATCCSFSWFESMDIKHLQLDTLGYLISDALLMGGNYSLAFSKINHASRFYNANYKDTFDYLVSFYKIGSFTKIEEIMKLKERLNLSVHYSSNEIDKMVLNLILITKKPEAFAQALSSLDVDLEKIDSCLQGLCDNRDFSVFRILDSNMSEQIETNKKRWFDDQVKWIRLRNLLIRTIISGHHSLVKLDPKEANDGKSDTNNDSSSNGTKCDKDDVNYFYNILDQLKESYESMKRDPVYLNPFPLQGPQPSRINYYKSCDYLGVLLKLFDLIKLIHDSGKENVVSWDSSWLESLKTMVNEVTESSRQTTSFFRMGRIIADLSNVVETICFAVVQLGLINLALKRDLQEAKKSKKKRNIDLLSVVTSLVEKFNNNLTELEVCVKSLTEYLANMDLSKLLKANIDDEIFTTKGIFLLHPEESISTKRDIISKIEKSYRTTANELSTTLSHKIKYLNCLKL